MIITITTGTKMFFKKWFLELQEHEKADIQEFPKHTNPEKCQFE